MESRFGHDFSQVRVHTDPLATESAHAVNALAYTVGRDIVFGRDQYAPHSNHGRQLLAHELTHVLQQKSSPAPPPTTLSISQPGDAAERQADDAARRVSAGTAASAHGAFHAFSPTQVHLARQTAPAKGSPAEGCTKPCGKHPWVEITPKRLMAICKDTVTLGTPEVPSVSGCMPGKPGKVLFTAGIPGWAFESDCEYCRPGESQAAQSRPDPNIQIGYIQTVERALQGGVYYKRVKKRWVPVDRKWFSVGRMRDCLGKAKAPWYGDKQYGPQKFGSFCPELVDEPRVTLETHKGKATLRRMRIDGRFHIWLIAKLSGNRIVFIHHWTIDALAVAVLPDDADPCNFSQWKVLLGGKNTAVTASGPGKGPETPVLKGDCANATIKKQMQGS